MKDLEFTLNDILNKALITNRIKNPNSNKIAEFVTDWMKANKLNIGVVSNSVCPKCGTKGDKTTLTENSYACKKCETWWANGC